MMGEMGIDWGSAGGFRAGPGSAAALEDVAQKMRQAAAHFPGWAVFVTGGGAADWAGYPGMKREYLQLDARARRRNERQFRRRRHAGHHGGIRWATLVAAYRKMAPVRCWVAEGYTR